MLIPYPDSFPNEALLMLLDKIRGKNDVQMADLMHSAWCVQGYAQKQIMGGGPVVTGEPNGISDEEALQAAIDSQKAKEGEPAQIGLVPWVIVLKIAIKIITASL